MAHTTSQICERRVIHKGISTHPTGTNGHGTIEGIKTAPDRRANVDRSLAKSPPSSAKTREVSMARTNDTSLTTRPIAPDDPRHGTDPGYNAGCRSDCCRHAHMVRMKRYRMYGGDSLVDATGTHRRIQALAALGYTLTQLSDQLSMSTRYAGKLMTTEKVRPGTAAIVHEMYDRLSMTRPEGWVADRARILAAAKGWAPPLAWDDIDDPRSDAEGLRKSVAA